METLQNATIDGGLHPSEPIYKTLKDSGEIRLLVLLPGKDEDPVRCLLRHEPLPAETKYETISYAWGDPTEQAIIEADGKPLTVTHSLYLALKNLRFESEERVIWADAVCINQQDLEERSSQVKLMGEIYANADQVIVWLGESNETVKSAIDQFMILHQFFLENEDGYPDHSDRWRIYPAGGSCVTQALLEREPEWRPTIGEFGKYSWFVRRWVIQEVAKARAATVVVGKQQISWTLMANVIWSLHRAGVLQQFGLNDPDGTSAPGIQSIILIELVRRDVLSDNGSKLLELIISVRQYKCLDPRDVIYSALGVACDLDTYKPRSTDDLNETLQHQLPTVVPVTNPDYTLSVEEVYLNFVLTHLVVKKSLLPLSANYIPPDSPIFNLPSWVPDFSNLSDANPLMHLRNETGLPFSASKGSMLDVHFSNQNRTMRIKGRIIDTISAVSPPQEDIVLTPELEDKSRTEDWDPITIVNEKAKIWYQKSLALFDPKPDDPDRIYGLTPKDFAVFAQTLVCGLSGSGVPLGPEIAQNTRQYLDIICEGIDVAIERYSARDDYAAFVNDVFLVEGAMSLRASGFGFTATEGGRMGRVLKSAEKGDKVVLLHGGEVPYILRTRDEGGWTFRGSCYIQGLMRGEGMEIEGVVDQEFDIY